MNIGQACKRKRRMKAYSSIRFMDLLIMRANSGSISAWLVAGLFASGTILAADAPASGAFVPTIPNKTPAPKDAPEGMVWVPGGEFSMGANGIAAGTGESCCTMNTVVDTVPIHRVAVDGFWMDATEVTNAQFAKFVEATGYKTIAEIAPTKEEFPNAPPENLVAGSIVFAPTDGPVPLDNYFQWWTYIHGADWRHPEGPQSSIKGHENDPVVQVAYPDAVAYAKWAGKRLPTEAEWEFADRGGLSGKVYAWGDKFKPGGKFMANTYQGKFPVKDTGEDGFVGIAPVKSFPPNGYGLYDMAGNVWEWTSDWYRPDYFVTLAATGKVARNPQGPDTSFDPGEPDQQKRVQKGGSYLCTDQYCSRYIAGTRGKGDEKTATNHLGFRCVLSAPTASGESARTEVLDPVQR